MEIIIAIYHTVKLLLIPTGLDNILYKVNRKYCAVITNRNIRVASQNDHWMFKKTNYLQYRMSVQKNRSFNGKVIKKWVRTEEVIDWVDVHNLTFILDSCSPPSVEDLGVKLGKRCLRILSSHVFSFMQSLSGVCSRPADKCFWDIQCSQQISLFSPQMWSRLWSSGRRGSTLPTSCWLCSTRTALLSCGTPASVISPLL